VRSLPTEITFATSATPFTMGLLAHMKCMTLSVTYGPISIFGPWWMYSWASKKRWKCRPCLPSIMMIYCPQKEKMTAIGSLSFKAPLCTVKTTVHRAADSNNCHFSHELTHPFSHAEKILSSQILSILVWNSNNKYSFAAFKCDRSLFKWYVNWSSLFTSLVDSK